MRAAAWSALDVSSTMVKGSVVVDDAWAVSEDVVRNSFTSSRRTVCFAHLHDDALKENLATHLSAQSCSFCDRHGSDSSFIAVEMDALMELVMSAVFRNNNYAQTVNQAYSGSENWFGVPTHRSQAVVEGVCHGAVDEHLLEAIVQSVPPTNWAARSTLISSPDYVMRREWEEFAQYVMHTARFLFLADSHGSTYPGKDAPQTTLAKISQAISDLGLIDTLPPGVRIWRGRMQADGLRPNYTAADIGSAPKEYAGANRMSPAGVSMFYCSESVATAIAEIATHDTRRFAAVAAFETVKQLSVVDLTSVPEVPSVFDTNKGSLRYVVRFLRSFADEVSKTVSLDGREHIDYVPTQILTEYFRWISPLQVDGIKFRSAQDDGINWVVFTGPEGCVDPGVEVDTAVLRLVANSERVVRVVARALDGNID